MGKASRISTARDRLKKQQTDIKNLQAINRIRNVPRAVAATATAGVSAAGSSGGTGNFLRPEGDTMIGPLALNPPVDFTVEIDGSNTIDIGESSSNSQYSSNIEIIDAASSTLDIIKGAAFDGQLLIIRTFVPSPITIRQATLGNGGNIQTPSSTDVVLGGLQIIILVFDDKLIIEENTGGTWRVLNTFGGGGGGSLSEPIELGFNEVVTQTPPTKTIIAGNQFNPSHVTLDQDIEIRLDISGITNKYKSIFVIFDTTGGEFTVTWPTSVVNPPIINDTITQRISVILYTIDNGTLWTHATSVGSSSSSPTIDEFFGPWTADHDAGLKNLTNVGNIDFNDGLSTIFGLVDLQWFQAGHQFTSVTDQMNYRVDTNDKHVFHAGATSVLEIDGSGVIQLNMLDHRITNVKDMIFDTAGGPIAFSGAVPAIGYDSTATELLYNAPDNASHVWSFNLTNSMILTPNNLTFKDGFQTIFNPDGVNAGINIGLAIGDPSTTNNGDLWYNSSTNKFRTKENGIDVDVVSGGIQNSIAQLDSNVTVLDTGVGQINFTLDGSVVGSFTNLAFLPVLPIDMTTAKNIIGVGKIGFTSNVDAIGNTEASIALRSDNFIFNVANTPDQFQLKFNGTLSHTFTNTSLTSPNLITDATLVINDSSTFPIADGVFSRNGDSLLLQSPIFQIQRNTTGTLSGDFNLTKVDATPSGNDPIYKINFTLFDSPNNITYSQIRGEIRDVTDAGKLYLSVRSDNNSSLVDAIEIIGDDNNSLAFMNINARISSDLAFGVEIGSTDLKIFPGLNSLGIVVQDNVAFTVGSNGTLAGPIVNSTPPLTDVGMDADFGDHIGAEGGYVTSASTVLHVQKFPDGHWYGNSWLRQTTS